jgi:hypothetical protein
MELPIAGVQLPIHGSARNWQFHLQTGPVKKS